MSGRALRALAGIAVLTAGLTVGATAVGAAAVGAAPGTQSVRGSGLVGLGHGLNAFRVDFRATRAPDGAVTGQFRGTGRLTGFGVDIPLPVALAGPVTCLTVRGDTAAFLYPLESVTPAPLQPLLGPTSIKITVKQGAAGRPAKVGFLGPVPTALTRTCAPTPAVFTLEGTASVDDGH